MTDYTPSPAAPFSGAAQAFLANLLGSTGVPAESEFALSLQSLGVDAAKLAALQSRCFQQHAALWQSTLTREAGGEAAPVAKPENGDRRFSSAEWRTNPWFDYLRQSYLINSRFLTEWVEALKAEPLAKERLRFITRHRWRRRRSWRRPLAGTGSIHRMALACWRGWAASRLAGWRG